MKKVFLVYGHYNDKSFNSAIKDNFIKSARENGHLVECIDLYKEKFDPVYAGENADDIVLDHRRKIDDSDLIVLVAPIWNYSCLLYTSPSPRDLAVSRMPSSA